MASVTNLRVITTVVFGVAEIVTCSRVFLRAKKRRFWFDDALALLAAVFSLVALVNFWIGGEEISKTIASWITNAMVISVIWLVRLSLLCSLIRLLPYHLRKTPYGFVALFVVMWTILLAVLITLCRPSTEWWQVNHQCRARVALFTTLFFEFSSGIIVTMLPVVICTLLKKSSNFHRRMIWLIAIIGLLLLEGSITHAVFFITSSSSSLEQLTAILQVGSGLLLINLPALITLVYKVEDLTSESEKRSFRPLKAFISSPRPLSAHSLSPSDLEKRRSKAYLDSWYVDKGRPKDRPLKASIGSPRPLSAHSLSPSDPEKRRSKAYLDSWHVDKGRPKDRPLKASIGSPRPLSAHSLSPSPQKTPAGSDPEKRRSKAYPDSWYVDKGKPKLSLISSNSMYSPANRSQLQPTHNGGRVVRFSES